MSARMQELLRLLSLVVDRVRAATARAECAEARISEMAVLLDAMAEENATLREDLERTTEAGEEANRTIRTLRDQLEASARLTAALETRAAEAELRIHRAADALGLTMPDDPSRRADVEGIHAPALH